MTNDEFTPEEFEIITRLRNAPQPQLDSTKVDMIRDMLFQELDAPSEIDVQSTTQSLAPKFAIITVVVVVVIIVGIVIVNLVSSSGDSPQVVPSATPELIPSISPSETSPVTITEAVTPSPTPLVEPSVTQPAPETQTPPSNLATTQLVGVIEGISGNIIDISGLQVDLSLSGMPVTDLQVGMTISVSGTLENGVVSATNVTIITVPNETYTPETTPASDANNDSPLIVIEGAVQTINIDYITIFDIDIQIDPSDPILTEIRLGDIIRVEGETQVEGGMIIIVAVNITIIQVQAITIIEPNAPVGGGLPANCRTNRSGRITCRSRRS